MRSPPSSRTISSAVLEGWDLAASWQWGYRSTVTKSMDLYAGTVDVKVSYMETTERNTHNQLIECRLEMSRAM